jgi:protein pelota
MVVAIESGLANIGLISDYSLNIISTIRHNIPGKRYLKQNFNLEVQKFLDQTTQVILENIKKHSIKLIILCGPGFVKEQYQKILGEVLKKEHLDVGIRVGAASSGTKSAIIEIIKNGTISKYFSEHRLSIETRYVEAFIERLGKDNGLFTYGLVETMNAAETGAVEDLLVTDLKMRVIGSKHKERIEDLFLMVEKNRGKIHIVSTLHPSGEQIQNYGGIISLLRFKVQ